jgi:hypothetical protein
MSDRQSSDQLDLIPEPAEIQRRIASTARAQRLLRRLLRLSLTVRRERELAIPPQSENVVLEREEVAHAIS